MAKGKKMEDMKQSYEDAVLQIKLKGAVVVENDMTCCRGCASYEMASKGVTEDTKLAWTYGGQGTELIWEHGQPMFAPEEFEEDEDEDGDSYGGTVERPTPADGVYWYHQAGGGKDAADCFRQNGFEVVWNGEENTAVFVKFA